MVERAVDMFSEEAKRHFKKRIEDDEKDSRLITEDGFMDRDSFLSGVLMAENLKGNLRAQFYSSTNDDEDEDNEQYYGMRPDDEEDDQEDDRDRDGMSSSAITRQTMDTYHG